MKSDGLDPDDLWLEAGEMGGFTLLMTGFWAEAEAELEAEVEARFWAEMGAAPAPTSDDFRFWLKVSAGVGCPDVEGILRCLSLATGQGEYSLDEWLDCGN